jgi:hypothetical protein
MAPLNWEREAKLQRMRRQGSVPYWTDLRDFERELDVLCTQLVTETLKELEDLVAAFRLLSSSEQRMLLASYREEVTTTCDQLRSSLPNTGRNRFGPAIDRAERGRNAELEHALWESRETSP